MVKECPEGTKKLNEKQCIEELKTKLTCPVDYFRVDDETCLKVVEITTNKDYIKLKCPKGHKEQNGKCVLGKKSTKHCGLGKKLIEGKCVSVVKPIVCPKGYHRHGKHRCVKVVNCPKGFTKVQFGCKKSCYQLSTRIY